jgi:CheY-specific phosphatase CheX
MNRVMPDPSFKDLMKLYGLEPVPESVTRLTQLVASQDADLREITRVISQDASLEERLLRAANPKARKRDDYEIGTIDEALMRMGMGCVLLLAMGAPLTIALLKTFKTMLGEKLDSVNPRTVEPFVDEHILCTIGFSGKATGRVYLRLSFEGAHRVAAEILGLGPKDPVTRSEVDDAVGELLNIVTGNFKSNLCDAGLDCHLHTPSVTRTYEFNVKTQPGMGLERMAFKSPGMVLFVDIAVNPWTQG